MARLIVWPVRGPALDREFRALPYRLRRGDRSWVPPLRSDERRRWSDQDAALRHRECVRFLVRRGRRTLGRVAAVIDPAFTARWEPRCGFFGFFECAADPEAARALLGAAEAALCAAGMVRVLGPIDLSTHSEVGLQVEGHERRPALLSPHHPPHYAALIEAAGYRARAELDAYEWFPSCAHSGPVSRLLARDDGVVVRSSRWEWWDEDLARLHGLYHTCFADSWGFVPLSAEELADRAAIFRPFFRPELALFAERDGEAIGFALALPDAHHALARARGRLWPLGWLRLWRDLAALRQIRFILLGVKPEHCGSGVAVRLAHHMAEAARSLGMSRAELSLIRRGNRPVERVIAAFGAQRCCRYRLYEKDLSAT